MEGVAVTASSSAAHTSETNAPPVAIPDSLLLHRAAAQVSSRVARTLRGEGFTVEQWRVLDCLVRYGDTPMSEIASVVLLPAPTLTRLVDKLVSLALVYRATDLADRRRVLVQVSGRGRALHDRLVPLVLQAEAEALEILTPEETDDLHNLLSRFA